MSPTKDNCPECGHTLFKKSGRGFKKPFCINEACPNFSPKTTGYKKKDKEPAERTPKEDAKAEPRLRGQRYAPAKTAAAGKAVGTKATGAAAAKASETKAKRARTEVKPAPKTAKSSKKKAAPEGEAT
jgi:DNA topoisomerase-1